MVGDRGREVEDELTGGVGETERERERAGTREGNNTDRLAPQRSERERGGVSALGSAPTGGACL
jgi:hypothetical protein